MLLDGVRADVIPEVMPLAHHVLSIKPEIYFLAAAVEIVEYPELFCGIHFRDLGSQSGKTGGQLCAHTGKVGSGILNILFTDRYRNILLLNDAVTARGFTHDDIVVLHTVVIQIVIFQLHQNRIRKVFTIEMPVVQGDLGGSTAVQTVNQRCIRQKQLLLRFLRCNHIVNIRELKCLGIPGSNEENAIPPHTLDRYDILHPFRNTVRLLIFFHHLFNRFHVAFWPPFRVSQWCLSSVHSKDWWAESE